MVGGGVRWWVVGEVWGAWNYKAAVVGGGVYICGRRLVCGPHRVPVDQAASEINIQLYARVCDVHAHALACQVAVVIAAVDRAACVPGASDVGERPGKTIGK